MREPVRRTVRLRCVVRFSPMRRFRGPVFNGNCAQESAGTGVDHALSVFCYEFLAMDLVVWSFMTRRLVLCTTGASFFTPWRIIYFGGVLCVLVYTSTRVLHNVPNLFGAARLHCGAASFPGCGDFRRPPCGDVRAGEPLKVGQAGMPAPQKGKKLFCGQRGISVFLYNRQLWERFYVFSHGCIARSRATESAH